MPSSQSSSTKAVHVAGRKGGGCPGGFRQRLGLLDNFWGTSGAEPPQSTCTELLSMDPSYVPTCRANGSNFCGIKISALLVKYMIFVLPDAVSYALKPYGLS